MSAIHVPTGAEWERLPRHRREEIMRRAVDWEQRSDQAPVDPRAWRIAVDREVRAVLAKRERMSRAEVRERMDSTTIATVEEMEELRAKVARRYNDAPEICRRRLLGLAADRELMKGNK